MASSRLVASRERGASLRLHRLKHDISEFLEEPHPGIEIFLHDDNYENICLHLTPQDGPMRGLRLHFTIQLSEAWPQVPPRFKSSYPAALLHPNLVLDYVCGEVLNENNSTGGYLTAFTLRALCMQLLSIFSSTSVVTVGMFGYMTLNYGEHIRTRYVPEDYLIPEHQQYRRTIEQMFEIPDWTSTSPHTITCWSGQSFQRALKDSTRATEIEYVNVGRVFGESAADCEPGTWAGWDSNGDELPQREVEITRLVPRDDDDPERHQMARVQCRNPLWNSVFRGIRAWAQCDRCRYNQAGAGLPVVQNHLVRPLKDEIAEIDAAAAATVQIPEVRNDTHVRSPTTGSQEKSPILELPGDVLLLLAEHLSTESIRILSTIHPRFQAVVKRYHIIRRRELQCVVLRTGINSYTLLDSSAKNILGIAIGFHNEYGTFRSSFDWLSLEAFERYSIDMGTDYSRHDFYLPLAFSDAHFRRAYPTIWRCLNWIALFLEDARQGDAQEAMLASHLQFGSFSSEPDVRNITVLYDLINDGVVHYLRTCDNVMFPGSKKDPNTSALLGASEKAITAFYQLFYLLARLTAVTPTIRTNALAALTAFQDDKDSRTEDHVPDLGHLIVQLALVNATADQTHDDPAFHGCVPWETTGLLSLLLQETLVRNAKWMILLHQSLRSTESWGEVASTVFEYSWLSLRLLMLQTFFMRFIVDGYRDMRMQVDDYFGFPPPDAAKALLCEVEKIYAARTWTEAFEYLGCSEEAKWDEEHLCQVIRESIAESGRRGYIDWMQPREPMFEIDFADMIGSSRW
ncbi:hypothetical protein TWF696_003845 [Orbilia brochopaga]|uniref:UBC core domain-containing protein n=1 Tax=Orbilia brochopaga TaxID=3140254 RepID=A0AAV9VAU6_9PEZI